MKTIVYCKCGAKTTPRKYRADGWIKIELTYQDGNRWTRYTCPNCRASAFTTDPRPVRANS